MNKFNKKAFTLIELLAVIVILAIIALIAVPVTINIINDSKEKSNKMSVELYGKAVKQAIFKARINGEKITPGNLSSEFLSTVQYSGSKVECKVNKLYKDDSIYFAGCTVGTDTEEESNTKEYTFGIQKTCSLIDGKAEEVGSKYTCSLDKNRYFYVLGQNASDENKIDLIMDSIYSDETVPKKMAWCDPNGDKPNSNTCNHDGLDSYIEYIQEQFGDKVTVSLPTLDQVSNTDGTKDFLLEINKEFYSREFWTDSADKASYGRFAHGVLSGKLTSRYVNTSDRAGICPVITVSINDLG